MEGRSEVSRLEVPRCSGRPGEEDRAGPATDGDFGTRVEIPVFDDRAETGALLARTLTVGWRRSRASTERARPVASAAFLSMLRATPSGRAMEISRPFIVTVLCESLASAMACPPFCRISRPVGAEARISMRRVEATL
jgi:hypothetical protein